MRRALAAALPFALLADGAARAATTISTGQTTPVATSTAGDVTIQSGGSITVSGTTPALTIDSSNNASNAGAISISNVNGATGVLINGGNTGSFTNTGTINVGETYAATDSKNSDGIVEAPFASGSGRYGVRLVGASPFIGSIVNTGTITVQGNASYGVSLEAQLAGTLTQGGTLSLTGDSGAALRELAGVTGNVNLTGATSAKGQGSNAVDLEGDVGGRVSVYTSLTSTGYSSTTRPTAGTPLTNVQTTPTDVEQGGSALIIGGNVAGGVYVGGAPGGTVSGTTADVNGDGSADGAEPSGTISTYGAAPAVVLGAAGKAITLGAVAGTDGENVVQPANAYGFINRGTIQGLGVYDGVTATAMQIGGQNGGSVALSGGLRNVGSIQATAYSADSTGLVIGVGASVPELRNEGTIQGIIAASTGANTATAVSILAGAQVGKITNTGSLLATVTGNSASAAVVTDRSGSVGSVLNEGVISGVITATAATSTTAAPVVPTGTKVALDLSANTTGVTLIQQTNPNVGVVFGNAGGTSATTTSTATATVPIIIGDVLLGSGSNNVSLLAGSLTGALNLGGGAGGSLTLDNGAVFTGDLLFSGKGLAVNLANGTLTDTSATTINAASLNVGATSKLFVAIDPVAGTSTRFAVSGPATFASGSAIGFTTKSLLTGPQSFTLVTSPNLRFGGTALALSASPYLLVSSLASSTTAGAGVVTLNVRLRTPAEIGLNAGETTAFSAVYAALAKDAAVSAAFFTPTDAAGFTRVFDRALPDYAGGVFELIDKSQRQIADIALAADLGPRPAGRLWTQEFVIGAQHDGGSGGKFTDVGFGIAAGAESEQGPLGALGLDAAFTVGAATSVASNKVDVYGLNGGVYWRDVKGPLRLGARLGGAYQFFSGERDLSGLDQNSVAFTRTAKADWNGYTLTARGSGAYQFDFGRFFLRPQVHGDYVYVNEDKFTETGGGDAFNLSVASREGHELSGTATVAGGVSFGAGTTKIRPELEVGVRDVFDGTAGSTTAQFASGGNSFTLLPNAIQGAGVVARASVVADSEWYRIGLEASGESIKGKSEAAVLVRASASF